MADAAPDNSAARRPGALSTSTEASEHIREADANPASSTVGQTTEEIVLDFTCTVDDVAECNTFCIYRRPGAAIERKRVRRQALWRIVISTTLLAAFVGLRMNTRAVARWLYFLGVTQAGFRLLMPVLFILLSALLVICLLWLLHAVATLTAPSEHKWLRTVRRRIERHVRKQGAFPAQRAVVTPFGVIEEVDGDQQLRVWASYAAIHETENLIISVTREGEIGFVPKRALGEEPLAAARLQQINQWMHAGGGGQQSTLYPMLAANDVHCPGCNYNLRGVRCPVCPECSTPLEPGVWLTPRRTD